MGITISPSLPLSSKAGEPIAPRASRDGRARRSGVVSVLLLTTWAGAAAALAQIPQRTIRPRPIELGVSGTNPLACPPGGRGETGTLGALVTDGTNHYVLSNNHVIARRNEANPGEVIIQPGWADLPEAEGNCSPTTVPANISPYVIGELSAFEPIHYEATRKAAQRNPSAMDAAIAYAYPGRVRTDGYILGVGTIASDPVLPFPGQAVVKSGRWTGVTRGEVVDIDVPSLTHTEAGYAYFVSQIAIKGPKKLLFVEPGDSGALVLEDVSPYHPVALHWGSNNRSQSIATPVGRILDRFAVGFVGSSFAPLEPVAPIADPRRVRFEEVRAVRDRSLHRLAAHPDVAGVGIGLDDATGAMAIKVYALTLERRADIRLPRSIEGVPVFLLEVPFVQPHD